MPKNMRMNSDLTLVPLEAASPVRNNVSNGTSSEEPLMGFITLVRQSLGVGGNKKSQTLLDRFRVLIKDTRFFDASVNDLVK
jgi:hypothetical protein